MTAKTWPSYAKIVDFARGVAAHSRGFTPPAGFLQYKLGGGARWVWDFSVAPILTRDALRFRAFLHSLRGRSGAFEIQLRPASGRACRYTDGTDFTDATTFDDAYTAVASSAAAVAGAGALVFPASALGMFAVGDVIKAGGQLLRVVSVDESGSITVGVRPRLRQALASGAAVHVYSVTAEFKLATDPPAVSIIPGGRSSPISISAEEVR